MLIAFDMDGTLFDCSFIVGKSFQRGIQRFANEKNLQLKIPTTAEIMEYVGFPTDYIFESLFPELERILIPELNNICTEELALDVRNKSGILYPGVRELLSSLKNKNYILTIASNGMLPYLSAIVETYKLDLYLEKDIVVIDNDTVNDKNEIVKTYIEKYSPEKVIMIGDRVSDMNAAHANNTYFIGCAFGHAGDSEFKDEKYIVHSVNEIYSEILKITGDESEI